MSVRMRTAGVVVEVVGASGMQAWERLVRESCAGQELAPEDLAVPDVRVVVADPADDDESTTPGTDDRLLTRGAWTDGSRVVVADACSSGLDLALRPSGAVLEVRAHPHAGWRHRLLAAAAPDRQVLLHRAALVQYPALWWSGVLGRVPLHVSAATVGGYAVVLAGAGGVGKSTLVATLEGPGEAPVSDNLCASDGRTVHGLLEPSRSEGGAGRRMPHGRRESPWATRVDAVLPDAVVVLRRGTDDALQVRPVDPAEASREVVGGTYAAGELRRYWPLAATLALGTGRGPAHPDVTGVAGTLTRSLPTYEALLPPRPGTTMRELVDRVREGAAPRVGPVGPRVEPVTTRVAEVPAVKEVRP